jgi:hypothetical protein
MVVECRAVRPSAELALRIRPAYDPHRSDFDLTLGRRYVVLGLSFIEGVIWVDIPTDGGWPQTVPIDLFQVIDARCSRHWEVRYAASGELTLLPSALQAPDFASRVADDDPAAVAVYRDLCERMRMESLG